MNNKDLKEKNERQAFISFVKRAQLPIDLASIESRPEPEPDILCLHSEEGQIAFELTELCDPNMAKMIGDLESSVIWTDDPSVEVAMKKFGKTYVTQHPIELLLYVDGRLVTPDNVIVPTLIDEVDFSTQNNFRKVWFMGEDQVEMLYSAS